MILLADKGTSEYSVIIDAAASPGEQYAASELVGFIRQVAHATLPIIINDLKRTNRRGSFEQKFIVIGKNGITADLGLDAEIDSAGGEGFIIKNVGAIIVIAGGSLRGTLYGVYEFLETYLGCRWYTPDVSNIPAREKIELPELNVKKTPSFRIREAFDMGNFDGDWSARNKVNGHHHRLMNHHGGAVRYVGVHSFNRLVSPDKYFDEHPEYFSEINGVRVKEHSQLCLTNPDVLRIAIESVRRTIAENPECSIISVSQNDWGNYCTCENCRKIDGEEESHMGTVLRFVNAVHDAITREYPHISIDTLAYQYTRKLPKITKPRPGLLIRLCTIECCFAHPLAECHVDKTEMPSNFSQDIDDWSKVSRDIYVWDYTTDFANYLMPFANLNVLKRNLEFFKEHGVIGLFEEGAPNTPLSYAGELRQYVLAKLMYDLDLDDKMLMDEFYTGVFGPAAPYVKAYYEFWQEKSLACGEHLFEDDAVTRVYFTRENLDTARALLGKAMTTAADDAIRLRIEKITLSCDFMDMVQMSKGLAKDEAFEALLTKCRSMGMQRVTEWHTFGQSGKIFKEQDALLPEPRY